jgi:hypothetical protein
MKLTTPVQSAASQVLPGVGPTVVGAKKETMEDQSETQRRLTRVIRWAARVWSVASAAQEFRRRPSNDDGIWIKER